MALKSTIFKASLQLADIDHDYYADHPLTLARHPSETDERMMLRLAALALNAHQLRDLCGGDGTLAFGAGLSSPDEPDVMLTDYTGRKRLWIEVGQPEEKPIAKACGKADAVRVYALAPAPNSGGAASGTRSRGWPISASIGYRWRRRNRWPNWPSAPCSCRRRCRSSRCRSATAAPVSRSSANAGSSVVHAVFGARGSASS